MSDNRVDEVHFREEETASMKTARALAERIADIDFKENSDRLYLQFGGDGDLGEDLVSILTIIIEEGTFTINEGNH